MLKIIAESIAISALGWAMAVWTNGEKISKTDDKKATFKENIFFSNKKNRETPTAKKIKLSKIAAAKAFRHAFFDPKTGIVPRKRFPAKPLTTNFIITEKLSSIISLMSFISLYKPKHKTIL